MVPHLWPELTGIRRERERQSGYNGHFPAMWRLIRRPEVKRRSWTSLPVIASPNGGRPTPFRWSERGQLLQHTQTAAGRAKENRQGRREEGEGKEKGREEKRKEEGA